MSSGNKSGKKKQQQQKGDGGGVGRPLKCPTEGIVNDADEIRAMVLDAMGLDGESWCSAVEVLDGASYVPGRGLQGVKVTLPLHEADRVTRLYRNKQNAQPLVSRGSVFIPTDNLSEEQFKRVRSNATKNSKGLRGMTSEMLAEHGSDVAQFFAHYGASTDLRHLYKQKAGELREGALCVWSAPEVAEETLEGIENALHEIAVLNTAEFSAEEEGDAKNQYESSSSACEEPVMVSAAADECFSASTTRVPRKPTDKLSPEDAKLQTELMTSVRDDIAAMRLKADTFNRAYAYALCTELKIPMGSICDEDEGMLDTHVGCTMSSLGFENGGGGSGSKSNAVVVATFNVNHSREGSKSALVFHSPESGSTLYEDMGSGAAEHHQQAGNNNNTVPSSLGRQRPAARGSGSSRDAPAAHGVQVPPLLDSVSDNVYATDTEVAGSFKEDLVHREAWAAAKSARHVAAEFYLSGAPNPVAKGGIANADDLARFLDGLVLPSASSASATTTVFVPDSGDRVCNMVREAHPDNWLDIITRDSAVRDAAGKTVGWRLPVDSLRHAAKA